MFKSQAHQEDSLIKSITTFLPNRQTRKRVIKTCQKTIPENSEKLYGRFALKSLFDLTGARFRLTLLIEAIRQSFDDGTIHVIMHSFIHPITSRQLIAYENVGYAK